MDIKKSYDELISRVKEVSILSSCSSILWWDQETYMPKAGVGHRSEQLGLLAKIIHKKFTDPRIGELLSELENSDYMKDKESVEAVNIREIRHYYDKQTKLPEKLVVEISKTTSLAQQNWAEARKKSDFSIFAPFLEKVINLMIEKADAYGYEGEPYNALLDDYEPGSNVKEIEEVFKNLKTEIINILERIKNAPVKPDPKILEGNFDVNLQRIFGESVILSFGFDLNSGRIDTSTHPFCSGIGPGDTRLTTRFDPNRLSNALFGLMHEAGHALYEMGIDKTNHFGTPMGEAVSLGIHESQSRLWENQVGRSKSFWKYFFPQAQRIFKQSLSNVDLDSFYGAINYVTPSYIRVEADETTYNLHILLRFELERALLNKELKSSDIPYEWNSRFKKYFGIDVDKDSNGCLQDIHWSGGLFGYFPTYTLGNLFAAQFFEKAKKDIPDLEQQFEKGIFSELRNWLKENIHKHGQRYRANVLIEKVTGKPLSHIPFINYLNRKYSEIYKI